jgi:hypothetical protein
MRLPQERARSFGQLGIHEHELGREQPFKGVFANETKPQFPQFLNTPCEVFGDPASAVSVRAQ